MQSWTDAFFLGRTDAFMKLANVFIHTHYFLIYSI